MSADKYHLIWDRTGRRYEVRHARLFLDGAAYIRGLGRPTIFGGLEARLVDMPLLAEEERARVRRVIVTEIEGYAAACRAMRAAPSRGPVLP